MLSLRFYYALKPFVPWRVRMMLRRITARRKRKLCHAIWPINEATSQAPAGWPGWPENKQFAFVITHDVEGPEGAAKCRQLAELEMELGFRSSFNFIPEGPYQVPPDLRAWLTHNGFEVGVHDLHHDGKLFSSRRGFDAMAKRINHYLNEWQACGYRSGFMLRNLDWLHELSILYDSSTFDTDPFEPQSEGAGTIFPYWIPSPETRRVSGEEEKAKAHASSPAARHSQGYVELPYTLPQDSTLFLVLEEKSPEIWRRKLRWIAEQGGMALLNVHPDYMNFSAGPGTEREYPASYYTEFLRGVSKDYSAQFWDPLPRELASWFSQNCRSNRRESIPPPPQLNSTEKNSQIKPPLRGKRAAVLQFSHYPFDPRPRRAAEAMVEAGMEVDVFCLSEGRAEPQKELVGGVRVVRSNIRRRRGTNKWQYFSQYTSFLYSSFWFLTRRSLRNRYDVVHVHNMPDFLVFAALVPKLRGAKIILDLHDPMPELLVSMQGMNPTGRQVRMLKRLERWSILFADIVLTPNLAFQKLFVSRGCRPEKIALVMNSPEEKIFAPVPATELAVRADKPAEFRIMHHGLIAYRHGVDLLVEAVARIRPVIPGVRLDLYGGRTPFLDRVLETAERLGVADIVTFHGEKSQSLIARAILEADLGVVPNRRSVFTDLNFPTRIFEYLAMGCPVIAPATHGIQDYFTSEQLLMFEPGDVADLVAKILWVRNQPEAARAIQARGVRVYREHLWSAERTRFLGLVGNLVLGPPLKRPKRICMITHSFYETDNRVTRYAEALAARGDHVDVLALRRSPAVAQAETIQGVCVFRIQDRYGKTERSMFSYLWPALRFLVSSSWWVTRRHEREPYDLLHIHNIPDFLVFAAWYPKLTGARVILDIHDIVPEFFGSKFGQNKSGAMTLLLWMERWSARFANHIIISNHLWLGLYATRTGTVGRSSVFINNVNTRVFRPRLRTRQDGKLIVLFPGGLQWHQGLDIALHAFVRVSRELPQAEFHIYGDGNMKPALLKLTDELALNDKVRFFDPVRITEIAQVMANADLGVVPKRADSFGNEAYSTKIMEFMSLGVPVVVSRTKIDQFYFNDSVVRFFESGNAEKLAEAMLEVLHNPTLRQQLIANATAYAEQNSWESRKADYLQLVDSMV